MKNRIRIVSIFFITILLLTGCTNDSDSRGHIFKPNNTYLILFEMNHYPEGYSELENSFINIKKIQESFTEIEIPQDHFFIQEDDLTEATLQVAFEWLEDTVPSDAKLIFYIGAHGSYLENEIKMNDNFPDKWDALEQSDKILIIDSCFSGHFIKPYEEDVKSGITYGIVSEDELNWWAEESDETGIVGSVWVHYFVEGLLSKDVDYNGDKAISFTELHEYANTSAQSYMEEYVFSIPEYLDMYEGKGHYPRKKEAYPNAVMDNHLEYELILNTY